MFKILLKKRTPSSVRNNSLEQVLISLSVSTMSNINERTRRKQNTHEHLTQPVILVQIVLVALKGEGIASVHLHTCGQ